MATEGADAETFTGMKWNPCLLCVCSGCCVSAPVHLESEEACLEAGARRADVPGSGVLRPGPVCRVRLPQIHPRASPVLHPQLGGHLYCGAVCSPGTNTDFVEHPPLF